MKKLSILFVALLLISVVGCGSGDSVTGPDTSNQIQNDTAEKPANPGDPTDTMTGPNDDAGKP